MIPQKSFYAVIFYNLMYNKRFKYEIQQIAAGFEQKEKEKKNVKAYNAR